jgi:hypothetical protein
VVSKLPGVEVLAVLVSKVTGAVLGTTFDPADRMMRGESICEQMVMVRIPADPDLIVVLSVDTDAGRNLSAAVLGRSDDEIAPQMIDKGAAELLTTIAMEIASFLQVDRPVGAPQRTTLGQLVRENGALDFDEAILLRSRGNIDVGLWILEEHSGNKARPHSSGIANGLLRFLLRTIGPRKSERNSQTVDIPSFSCREEWNEARLREDVQAADLEVELDLDLESDAQLLNGAYQKHRRRRLARRNASPPPLG